MIAWIGGTDHDAADDNNEKSPGPIARVTRERTDLDGIHLLNNYSTRKSAPYKKWLRATTKTKARITTREVKLDTPTDFSAIYSNVLNEIDTIVERYGGDVKLIFNLSSGTYGMAAVWIILQQTLYPNADVIEASPEGGVKKTVTRRDRIVLAIVEEIENLYDWNEDSEQGVFISNKTQSEQVL